ncbi:unannotated protein [freshwater metagenome]|uniref:Unannotated protein n=1 Tax=freshwater metagenome TaxID=449393 RepID=A0A6J6GCW9_9ZZZZ
MLPSPSTGAITVLAMICRVTKLRLEASGLPDAHGYTVRNPPSLPTSGSTAVTFKTTASIPEDGRPPWPYTLKIMGSAVPVRLPILPVGRVLMTRDGVNVTRPPLRADTDCEGGDGGVSHELRRADTVNA